MRGDEKDFTHFVLRGGEAVPNRNRAYSNVWKPCYPRLEDFV